METKPQKSSTENFVKDIRNKTRRIFTSEQKILIVMEAIRGESPVEELFVFSGKMKIVGVDYRQQ
jgi:transposase